MSPSTAECTQTHAPEVHHQYNHGNVIVVLFKDNIISLEHFVFIVVGNNIRIDKIANCKKRVISSSDDLLGKTYNEAKAKAKWHPLIHLDFTLRQTCSKNRDTSLGFVVSWTANQSGCSEEYEKSVTGSFFINGDYNLYIEMNLNFWNIGTGRGG